MTAFPDGQGLALADEIERYLGSQPFRDHRSCLLTWTQWQTVLVALRALPPASTTAQSVWRTIDSAPKGKRVLVNDPRWGVTEGLQFDSGAWGVSTFNGTTCEGEPTHWTDLPGGPQSGETR